MKKKAFFLGIVLLVLFARMPAAAAPVSADAYNGIDMIFLVDQSGSMSGLCNNCPFNDPLDLRFYSLSYAMKWMGENFIGTDANKMPFRVAIVNFGTTADAWNFGTSTDSRYWQEIAPVSQAEWDTLYIKKIEPDLEKMKAEYKAQSLKDTDFSLAFKTAKKLFSSQYLPESQGEHHQRVVVVLTDGQPNPTNPPAGFTMTGYMDDLAKYVQRSFPSPDYRIYVVGMPDQSDPYWSRVRTWWEAITNDPCPGVNPQCSDLKKDRASLVSNNQEVGNRFLNILIDLTNIQERTVVPGKNVLPPYLKTAIFTLFKTDSKENLILTDPTGKVVADSDPGVQLTGQEGAIEVVRVNSPLPGEWLIATNPENNNVIITKREIFAQSRLDSPLSGQVQYLPVKIQYALLDEAGGPLPNYGQEYPLIVEAEIRLAGQSWPLPLREIQSGNVYGGSFTPLGSGQYSIFVHAWTKDVKGQIVEVYNSNIGAFAVAPAVLVPTDLPTSWPQYQSKDLVFELRNSEGFPITTSSGNSDIKIAVAFSAAGMPDGAEVTLAPQPDGTYKASYSPQLQGEHVAHVHATVRDTNGNLQVITDADVGRFSVDPTTKVVIQIIRPASRISTDNNTDAWSLSAKPLAVEAVVTDDQGNPVRLSDIFDDPDAGLALDLKDATGKPLGNMLQFKLNKVTGHYVAETASLGVGEYFITVTGHETKPGYVYQEPDIPLQITRVTNPWLTTALGGTISFLVIAIAVGAFKYTDDRRRRRHPCQGKLVIVDGLGSLQWQGRLDPQNSNRIVFPRKAIRPILNIGKIQVECKSETDSKAGNVSVTLWMGSDNTPVINAHPMRPESERRIGTSMFWLLKDPSEEQLLEQRGDADDGLD